MVIAGGCSPQYSTPAEASTIAAALGIEAPTIDIASACSTMGSHMHFLSMMDPNALPEYVLCVLPENTTRTIDFSDRNTAVLWGDGTQATILSTKIPARAHISQTTLVSDPSGWDKVMISRFGHFNQQGSAVQSFAIKRTSQCFKAIAEKFPEKAGELYFIAHQANLTMLQSVCKRCNISDDRHLYNIDKFGNTGAAGAPTVLAQNWNKFKAGDTAALVVVGAGLTWASMMVEFTE
jgi:3-oxoacyl-[acyl-carrier-protein] synthase-3